MLPQAVFHADQREVFHPFRRQISPRQRRDFTSRREVLRLLGAEENYENMYLPGDI